ncbi:hypothetical protein [Nocardioides speluncae]|uniref:hypothetical protein n=1 Tax=Nocardioides speluncae TaxID=2670337 RepID=UPI000D69A73C|nr:hypothetical protein [Nocardioides speluncae]
MTKLWVALDHADPSALVRPGGGDLRVWLCEAIIAGHAPWGVVVPSSLLARALAHNADDRVCWGLPDEPEPQRAELRAELAQATTPVKVGYSHVPGWSCADIARLLLEARPAGGRLVLEPYCDRPDCLAACSAVLTEQRLMWKLTIVKEMLDVYAEIGFRGPWVARSGPLTWQEFVDQLAQAVELGCSGVIVGRALWADLLPLDEAARQALLGQRLATLRSLLDPAGQAS